MQGKKHALATISILFIVMFVVAEIYTIQVWTNMTDPAPEDLNDETILADIPPPRAAFSLSDLVTKLLEVTPVDAEDSDLDGLPNPVEAVLGTDMYDNDSDMDSLTDDFEVWNGFDPLEPDTNFDGLPDYYEATDPRSIAHGLDLDGDGVPNAWDFDNDDDTVDDAADISPFSKSVMSDRMYFDINTNGNPLFVSFQLIPKDPDHLSMINQYWDWPYDELGLMRDLHRTPGRDVRAQPLLKLNLTESPQQEDVSKYSITVTPEYTYVPLYPVIDSGDIVAFTGRLVFPDSSPSLVSFKAELIWNIIGQSDERVFALDWSTGHNVSIGMDDVARANSSSVSKWETFQWIELDDDTVALKLHNGPFLSVGDDGIIRADGLDIGTNQTFEVISEDGSYGLKSFANDMYVTIGPDDMLVAGATEFLTLESFQRIELEPMPETKLLVSYEEDFMLTGFRVEENYGSDVGIIFSSIPDETLLAQLPLSAEFARRTDTHISDLASILATYNVAVDTLHGSYPNSDDAFTALNNEFIPSALDTVSSGDAIPIITAMEDKALCTEMSEVNSPNYVMSNHFEFGLDLNDITTTKSLKTVWYQDTNVLALEQIALEIDELELEEDLSFNLLGLSIVWAVGEQITVGEQDDQRVLAIIDQLLEVYEDPSLNAYGFPQTLLEPVKELYKSWNTYRSSVAELTRVCGKGGFSKWQILKDMATETDDSLANIFRYAKKQQGNSAKALARNAHRWARTAGQVVDVVLLGLEIGIAMYGIYSIATNGLGAIELNEALLMAVMQYCLMLALTALSTTGIGAIISALLGLTDLIFGWSDKLFGLIIDAMTEIDSTTQPKIDVIGDPTIDITDYDENGVTVGDRITYQSLLQGLGYGTNEENADDSYVYPYYVITGPFGSETPNGTLYPYRDIYVPHAGEYYSLPIPTGSWTPVEYTEGSNYYYGQIYNSGSWVEPTIPMINFPVNIEIQSFTHLWYHWSHFVFLGVYAFWCHHDNHQEQFINAGRFTVNFDVFPESISDFTAWRSITPFDYDGDGIANTEEMDTDRYKYDMDGDSLNDKYEIEMGSDPHEADSDFDGLNDKYELIYGTNATNADCDSDGLRDYLEISGDTIQFNYLNDPMLPFTMIVHSNPRSNDSDLDGISDFIERRDGLNPCSSDTNGDGVVDVAGPPELIVFDELWANDDVGLLSPNDVTVDDDGNIYLVDTGVVHKYSPDGTYLGEYGSGGWPDYAGAITTLPDGNIAVVDGTPETGLQGFIWSSSPLAMPQFSIPSGDSIWYHDWVEALNAFSHQAPPVAIDDAGNTMVVGDPGSNIASVFERIGGSWVFDGFLFVDADSINFEGFASHTWFGASVDISEEGDVIVVGAPGTTNHGNDHLPAWWNIHYHPDDVIAAGAVHTFQRTNSGWVREASAIGALAGGLMGSEVAIQGTQYNMRVFATLEYREPISSESLCSSIIAWEYYGSLGNHWLRPHSWINGRQIFPSDYGYGVTADPELNGKRIYSLEAGPGVRTSVGLSSLVVGAYNPLDMDVRGSPAHKGIIRQYSLPYQGYKFWSGPEHPDIPYSNDWPYYYEAWESLNPTIGPGVMDRDQFGLAVDYDLEGDTIVVGAPHHEHAEGDSNALSAPGYAYVYEADWPYWDPDTGEITTRWIETPLEVPGISHDSEYGFSVAIDHGGNTIVVGAPGSDSNIGAAYVFKKIGDEWSLLTKLQNPLLYTFPPYGLGNRFGQQVGIRSDGSCIWVNTRRWSEPTEPYLPQYYFEYDGYQQEATITKAEPSGTPIYSRRIVGYTLTSDRFLGMASDATGSVYLSCYEGGASGIRKYDATYRYLQASFGLGELNQVKGIDVDSNDFIYAADYGGNRVWILDSDGEVPQGLPPILGSPDLPLDGPSDVAVDESGNIYIADTGNDRIVKFDSELIWIADIGVGSPQCIDIDNDGYIHVANSTHLLKFNETLVVMRPDVEDPVLDWDLDELTDLFEMTGWTISYTNVIGFQTKHINSSMHQADTDLDTLSDHLEWELGTNPRSIDTDSDSVPDAEELARGLDPLHFDTDRDLLDDGLELNLGTNPFVGDSDADGTSDYLEHLRGTDPLLLDTDRDGANDTAEFEAGTDPLSPDSDNDFVFDGAELDSATDPLNSDSDGDSIIDGGEWLLGTNPLSNDTDGDNVTDLFELMLAMNPLSNDTDGDGALDSTELLLGSSPVSNLSTPVDITEVPEAADIILAYDADSGAEEFAEALALVANVSVVTLEDLLANYTDAQRIILVGQPSLELGTVGGLISELLWDYGDALTRLNESDDCDYLARYGVWNETQLVLMFAEATPASIPAVLEAIKLKNVTILPDAYFVQYQKLVALEIEGEVTNPFFLLDEMDMVKSTDSSILVVLGSAATPIVQVELYNGTTTPYVLSNVTGLVDYEESLGKYLDVTVTLDDAPDGAVSMAQIKVYYRIEDLDNTGDGDADDIDDFNETTLCLYLYDEVTGEWTRLSENLDWVIGTGVNTTDVVLYGEYFAGYVWADVTHLSLYSVGGMLNNRPPDISEAFPSILFLWPPNGKFVPVTIQGVTDPDGDDVTITILNITSDEYPGRWPDAYGVGSDTAWLQAVRFGFGNGRVYEITFLASDGRGGESIGSVFVYVPHHKWGCRFVMPIDDGQIYDATDGRRFSGCWWKWLWRHFYLRCKHRHH